MSLEETSKPEGLVTSYNPEEQVESDMLAGLEIVYRDVYGAEAKDSKQDVWAVRKR